MIYHICHIDLFFEKLDCLREGLVFYPGVAREVNITLSHILAIENKKIDISRSMRGIKFNKVTNATNHTILPPPSCRNSSTRKLH